MKRPVITTAALAAVLTGCGSGSDAPDVPATTPTCITWTSTPPVASPSALPSAGPAGCTAATEQPIGTADGKDVPDCDAEDMLTGDTDCAHVLPPKTTAPTPTNSPKASKKKNR